MLLDEKRKQLDFQFVLWRFETKKLDMGVLHKMDVGLEQINAEQNEDVGSQDSEDEDGNPKREVEKIQGSSCCTIF